MKGTHIYLYFGLLHLSCIEETFRKASVEMIFNPSPETLISCSDILIVLGKPKKLVELESVMDDSHSVCLP